MYEDQRFVLIGRLEALRIPVGDTIAEWISTVREVLNDGGERLRDLVKELDQVTPKPPPSPAEADAGPGSGGEPAAEGPRHAVRDSVVRIIATAIGRLTNDRAEALSEQFSERIDNRISTLIAQNKSVQLLRTLMFALAALTGVVSGLTAFQGYRAVDSIETQRQTAVASIEREERSVKEKAAETKQESEKTLNEIKSERTGFAEKVAAGVKTVIEDEIKGVRAEIEASKREVGTLDADLEEFKTWVAEQIKIHKESFETRLANLVGDTNKVIEERRVELADVTTELQTAIDDIGGQVDAVREDALERARGRFEGATEVAIKQHETGLGEAAASGLDRLAAVTDGAIATFKSDAQAQNVRLEEVWTQETTFLNDRRRVLDLTWSTMAETADVYAEQARTIIEATLEDNAVRAEALQERVFEAETTVDELSTRLGQKQLGEMVDHIEQRIEERRVELADVTTELQTAIDDIGGQVDAVREDALERARGRFEGATEVAIKQHETGLGEAAASGLHRLAAATDGAIATFKSDAQAQNVRLEEVWTQETTFLNDRRRVLDLTWSTMAETADVYAEQARMAIAAAVQGTPVRVEELEDRVIGVTVVVDELATRLGGHEVTAMVDGVKRAIKKRSNELASIAVELKAEIDDIDTQVDVTREDALRQARTRFETATETALTQHEEDLARLYPRLARLVGTPGLETELWLLEHPLMVVGLLVLLAGFVSFVVALFVVRSRSNRGDPRLATS